MTDLVNLMKERLLTLKHAIKVAEREEESFPEGRLRINKLCREGNYCKYYVVKKCSDTTGDYIPVGNKDYIQKLAQKDYNKRFLKTSKVEVSILEKLIQKLSDNDSNNVFLDLSEERKRMVVPYILTDDLYALEWQAKKFKENTYLVENKIYDTRRGEKVRSKSEAIIADIFFELRIPYKYEAPIHLGGRNRYPDFTLLKMSSREEIFLEHFGLMDDEDYRASAFQKLDEYRENGIYLGKNLIITYETASAPLDIKGIRRMLKEIMLKR